MPVPRLRKPLVAIITEHIPTQPAYYIENESPAPCIAGNNFVYLSYIINQKLKTMPTVIQQFIWYFLFFPDLMLSNPQDYSLTSWLAGPNTPVMPANEGHGPASG
jgi:hypothetical protein